VFSPLVPPLMLEAPKRAVKFAANDFWGKTYRQAFGIDKMTLPNAWRYVLPQKSLAANLTARFGASSIKGGTRPRYPTTFGARRTAKRSASTR
jgi:hypothetical protein